MAGGPCYQLRTDGRHAEVVQGRVYPGRVHPYPYSAMPGLVLVLYMASASASGLGLCHVLTLVTFRQSVPFGHLSMVNNEAFQYIRPTAISSPKFNILDQSKAEGRRLVQARP